MRKLELQELVESQREAIDKLLEEKADQHSKLVRANGLIDSLKIERDTMARRAADAGLVVKTWLDSHYPIEKRWDEVNNRDSFVRPEDPWARMMDRLLAILDPSYQMPV